jgi:hypothetical protein
MKTKIIALIFALLSIVLASGIVYASDVDNAQYISNIEIINTGDAVTNQVAVFTYNSTAMIDSVMLNATATDCAMLASGTDVVFMPGYPDKWSTWINSIGASSTIYYSLYSGNVTGGHIAYFPGNTGMSIPDGMTEPGDNFTIQLNDTWIDTAAGANKTIFQHYDSTNGGLQCFVSPTVSGNITNRIVTSTSTTVDILPNAAGDYTNITTANPAVAHYLNVDDPVATPDDIATIVTTESDVQLKDAYNIETPTLIGINQVITSVTVYFRGWDNDAVITGKAQPGLRLSGVEQMGTEVDLTNVWTTRNELIARPGGGSWSIAELANLQVIIGLRDTAAPGAYSAITQVYVRITYTYETYTDVSATGLTSGEYDLLAGLETPFFWISTSASGKPPVSDTVTLNVPLWQVDCSSSPFTSIDGTGVACTVSEAVWTLNEGYTFDGVDDYIAVAHNANQLLTTGGTIEAWIKPNTIGETAGDIVDKSTASTSANGYRLAMYSGDKISFRINGGTAILSEVITYGNWYHVVATWDATGYVTMYVNGAQSGTPGISADPTGITTTNAIRVGNRSTATDRTFDGMIGEVRIYGDALTPAEVLQNYNATKTNYGYSGDTWVYSTLVTMPNSTGNYQFGSANTTPYMGEISYTQAGVLIDTWSWIYAATWPGTVTGNIGTPSFRTASSDADVTASVSGVQGTYTAPIPTTADTGGWAMATTPVAPGGLFVEGGTGFPLGAEVAAAATAAGDDPDIWVFLAAFGVTVGVIIFIYAKTHSSKLGRMGSLFLAAASGELVMIYFYNVATLPGWVLIPFPVIAGALLLLRKSVAPVD